MNQIYTLVTVVLSFAVIGWAGIQTARSNPKSASTVVESSSPTTLAQAETDPLAAAQMRPNYQFTVQRQSGTCPKADGAIFRKWAM